MRIPVPDVWIKNPGVSDSLVERPLIMALADTSWSASAQSVESLSLV
jgi:hypothetical protein